MKIVTSLLLKQKFQCFIFSFDLPAYKLGPLSHNIIPCVYFTKSWNEVYSFT